MRNRKIESAPPWGSWSIWVSLFLCSAVIVAVAVRATSYGSPDEAANAFFIHQLATTGQPVAATGLNSTELSYIHPRSMVIQGSLLKSGSFLGLIQVDGFVEHLFGPGTSRAVVPILSLIALAAFYGLLRRFWSHSWALLGTTLLAVNPVWFQFQTLPMFHNGAFASLLVVTGYFLRRQFEQPSWRWATAVGLAYGAALYFRPIEVIWTGPLMAIVLLTMPGRWKWFSLVVGLTLLVQTPWLVADQHVYGSALSTGYTPDGVVSGEPNATSVVTTLWHLFLPAGGQWSLHFLSSFWWYFVLMLPASSVLAAASLGVYFRRKFVTWKKVLKLTVVTALAFFPFIYYGSWNLYPLLSSSRVGTLSSYDRYWMIMFVAVIPGVVIMLKRLWSIRPWLAAVATILLLSSHIAMIVWHPGSGLLVRWERQREARQLTRAVAAATQTPSVIIAGQADKYFVGERLTAYGLPTTARQWLVLMSLSSQRPTYLLDSATSLSPAALQTTLGAHHLSLGQKIAVSHDTLWRIGPLIPAS